MQCDDTDLWNNFDLGGFRQISVVCWTGLLFTFQVLHPSSFSPILVFCRVRVKSVWSLGASALAHPMKPNCSNGQKKKK